MAKIDEPPEGGYTRERIERLRTPLNKPSGRSRRPLGAFTGDQLNGLFATADPATGDDVGITLEDGTELNTSAQVEAWFDRRRAGTPTP